MNFSIQQVETTTSSLLEGPVEVLLPQNSQFLSLEKLRTYSEFYNMVMWWKCDFDTSRISRKFQGFRSGQSIPPRAVYLGTYFPEDRFDVHVFELC